MNNLQNRFVRLRLHISNKLGRQLSASELAKEIGVSQSILSRVESGNRSPSGNLALRFQKRFSIDPHWLQTGQGQAPWETVEDPLHGFNSLVVDQKREDGEYPEEPIEKAKLAKKLIDTISENPRLNLILDHLIEAGHDPQYLYSLYDGLAGGFIALQSDREELTKRASDLRQKIRNGEQQYYDEKRASQKLKNELAELRPAAAEPEPGVTAGGHPGAGSCNDKDRPNLRMTADQTFESTEVILKFPEKPADLDPEESTRWDRNELALHRWEKSAKSFNVPTWAVERFCHEVVNFYEGGNLEGVGGLLKDIIQEGKKT